MILREYYLTFLCVHVTSGPLSLVTVNSERCHAQLGRHIMLLSVVMTVQIIEMLEKCQTNNFQTRIWSKQIFTD